MRDLVIGLDLGTGGARAVIVSAQGDVVASGEAPIASSRATGGDGLGGPGGDRHEQQPEAWWTAATAALAQALGQRAAGSDARSRLVALCVDGTSGTIVGLDAGGRATTPGLMYDDARAVQEAAELDALARADPTSFVPAIGPASGLAKMRWIERHLPAAFAATQLFAHQADVVAGRLTGQRGTTDSSNALKSGFDVAAAAWAPWLAQLPELAGRLPAVVSPGERLGPIARDVAAQLGLPTELVIIAGATDGTAAFLASGAQTVGDDNTTLGTTLVFKRLAAQPLRDPGRLLYCHGLPGRRWLPGAASNVGAGWIRDGFAGQDLARLDALALSRLPSPHLALPLIGRGERFPFAAPSATGFVEPPADDPLTHYAALLQGTALVERLAYDVLDRATGSRGSRQRPVYATGGGSRSDVWTQLRADVTGRTYHRPACPDSAFGSAILAAGATLHAGPWAAARAMVSIAKSFAPDPSKAAAFDEYHERFVRLLRQRGHLAEAEP